MEPFIVAEEKDYLVVFKPRGMHGAPLERGEAGTLLAWCAERFPEVLVPAGRKSIEGGLLHRLDRDTEGIVVLARNQAGYEALTAQQIAGTFLKEYLAVCLDLRAVMASGEPALLPGFPPRPGVGRLPFTIESAFRPFGPGRKAVRPVIFAGEADIPSGLALDRGLPYRTELRELSPAGENRVRYRVRLARGFRHQVRCHLSWIGFPIIGDDLYGGDVTPRVPLALSAVAVSFLEPASQEPVRYECSSPEGSESAS